jgi:hypothetical protein
LEALQKLLFKPGFTVRVNKSEKTPEELSSTGVDERLIWAGGLATLGEVQNLVTDIHFFRSRYYLLNLLLVCCSYDLSKDLASF